MVKIVILGSCRFEPYEILAVPKKLTDTPHTTEEGYRKACKIFHPAIELADEVWVYALDGIGEHTRRDMEFAKRSVKIVRIMGGE